MKKFRSSHFIILLLLPLLFSQCKYVTKLFKGDEDKEEQKKDAKDYLKLADRHFEVGSYYRASHFYAKVCSLKPQKTYPQHRLAESYRLSRDYKKAEKAYEKSMQLDKGTFRYPLDGYKYADMLKRNAQYAKAKEQFKKYLEGKALDALKRADYSEYRDYKELIEKQIKGCDFAKKSMDNPVPVNINHLGDEINTAYTEMAPLPVDSNSLIFGSLRSDTVISISPDQEKKAIKTVSLFKGVKNNGTWQVDTPATGHLRRIVKPFILRVVKRTNERIR